MRGSLVESALRRLMPSEIGYRRRDAGVEAQTLEFVLIRRPHDHPSSPAQPAHELATVGHENWDDYPRGRPYLVAMAWQDAGGRMRIVANASMNLERPRASVPLTVRVERHGVQVAEILSLPDDHAALLGLCWRRTDEGRRVERVASMEEEAEIVSLTRRFLTETIHQSEARRRKWGQPFPQGLVVGVNVGPNLRIPCVVVSPPWAQLQNREFHRVVVAQTMPYEDGDELYQPDVVVLRRGEFGLAEDRTVECVLLRTFQVADRAISAWDGADVHDWMAPSPKQGLTGDRLKALVEGVMVALGIAP